MDINALNWIFDWSSLAIITGLVALMGRFIDSSMRERSLKAEKIRVNR